MCLVTLLSLVCINLAHCDWVEVPIVSSNDDPKSTRRVFPHVESSSIANSWTESTYETFIKRPEVRTNVSSEFEKQPASKIPNFHRAKIESLDEFKGAYKEDEIDQRTAQEFTTQSTETTTNSKKGQTTGNNRRTEDSNHISEDEKHGHSYTGFLPLIKTIQSTLIRNSHKHFNGKLALLRNLRDTLMYNLREKMNELWGPKVTDKAGREFKDDHVDFPSNEGALMTIGFLTFAVALIKLILQLLNSYHNKNNGAVAALMGRKRRSITFNDEGINLLKLLEEYKLKY